MGLIPRHPRYPLPENYRKDFQKAEAKGELANAVVDYLSKLVRQMEEDYRNIYLTSRATIPSGGAANAVLTKSSANDYDTEWA